MSKNDKNIPADAFDKLLKNFLLEQEGIPPENNDLEQFSEQVFEGNYGVVPPPAREAELLAKLKETFSNPSQNPEPDSRGPGDGPEPGGGIWEWLTSPKLMVLAGTGIAAVFALWMLFFNPADTGTDLAISQGNEAGGKGRRNAGFFGDSLDNSTGLYHADEKENNTLNDENHDVRGDFVWGPNDNNKPPAGTDPNGKRLASTGNPDPMGSGNPITNRSPINPAPDRDPVDLPLPILQLFGEISPAPTVRIISGLKDHLIFGRQGTLIQIPANTFVYADGSPVNGEVKLEITEVYRKGDMILANVPTIEKEHLLESQGMVNIVGTSKGKPVEIAAGKNIYMEFALVSGLDDPDMELYKGQHDQMGNILWETAGGYLGSMIPLPVMEINFLQYLSPERGHKEWDKLIRQLNSPMYEKTLVATWEFVERLKVARRMGYIAPVLEMYMNNPDINMHEVDQMVAYYLRGNYRNYEFKNAKELGMEDFERFYLHALKRPIPFDNYGLNLDAVDAREILLSKGLREGDISGIMRTHQLRKQIIAEINGPILQKVANAGSKNVTGLVRIPDGDGVYAWEGATSWAPRQRSSGFRIAKLGWYNLDQIFDAAARTYKMEVSLEGETDGNQINQGTARMFLMISGNNSVIPGEDAGGGKFRFKNIAPGTRGKLVCLYYAGGLPYFGEKDVSIRENTDQTIQMHATTIDGLKASVRAYNQIF